MRAPGPPLAYRLLMAMLTPVMVLHLVWKSRRNPDYRRRICERFGHNLPPVPDGAARPLWLHLVSVGETLAAAPLVEALLARELPLLVTSTTPTGAARVRALFGGRVQGCYLPWDRPAPVRRFLQHFRPRLGLLMETELWPQLLAQCHANGMPTMLVNARMSARSAARYGRLPGLTRNCLARLQCIAAADTADAARFRRLGAPPERLHCTGNLKYDGNLSAQQRRMAAQLRRDWDVPQRPLLIAASTHSGEERQVLELYAALRRELPALRLLLVPRHAERFDEVAALCAARLPAIRYSEGRPPAADDAIIVGDVLGQLNSFYGAASLVLMGGTLVPRGGHNLVEPARWGLPICSGPSLFNFAHIAGELRRIGALHSCQDLPALQRACLRLLQNPALARQCGQAALQVAHRGRGALARLLPLIDQTLGQT